jgi:hypothetical protein
MAARLDFAASRAAVEAAAARGLDLGDLATRIDARAATVDRYVDAYARYCWPTTGLAGLEIAPFHLLASEGRVHVDRDHAWHMQALSAFARADSGLFVETKVQVVDLGDAESERAGTTWWEELTASGGEGMVVKPMSFVARGRRGLVQPAVKVRGRDYLRIIYGPEYTLPEHLERLRSRGLSAKRSLALREFALGVEALERFVRREPLYRIHECVFGVLAMESEAVDPRL